MTVTVDTGTGTQATFAVATDLIGSTHHPYAKLEGGAPGSTEYIDGTTANGLEVDVTRVQGSVTVVDGGGSLTVDTAGGPLDMVGTVAVSAVAGTVTVGGPAGEGASPAGNPVSVAARGQDTAVNQQPSGALVRPWATRRGALRTAPIPNVPNVANRIPLTGADQALTGTLDGLTTVRITNDNDEEELITPVILYVAEGEAASAANWTYKLYPGDALDTRTWQSQPTGVFHGFSSEATGFAQVTTGVLS